MKTKLSRLGPALLLVPALFVAACTMESAEDPETGAAGDAASEMEAEVDEAEVEAIEAEDVDMEESDESTDALAGMGMQHRYMQDMMHDEMLGKAVEMELFSSEDAEFFAEAHAKMEPFKPADASERMGRELDDEGHKAMQRSVTDMAVSEAAMTDEEAERFTALHDILIDNGLMQEAEGGYGMSNGGGMGQGMQHGAMRDAMQAAMHETMLGEAIELGLIDEADAELFNRVHAAIEPYMPEGSMEGGGMGRDLDVEGKKAMQRSMAGLAVNDGVITKEDGVRFTEIHDLLLDEGLMDAAEMMEE